MAPSCVFCRWPTRVESTTASPIAVPSPGLSESSDASTSCRFSVGGIPTAARVANETTPTRNFSGTFVRNAFAAPRAASRRVGATSFAFIERETSIASTTVASSRLTSTVACGLATPRTIAVKPSSARISGMWRLRPGFRSTTAGSSAGFVQPRANEVLPRSRAMYSTTATGTSRSATSASGQSKLNAASASGTPPAT